MFNPIKCDPENAILSLMVEHSPSTHKALCSTPGTTLI